MSPTFQPLNAGFSTADTEKVAIQYVDGDVEVHLDDWRETAVVIRFPSAVAFRWQDDESLPNHIRDDMPYEVIDSPWVAELSSLGLIGNRPVHHYKLCFNACGVFDVVSEPVIVQSIAS
jgi:hypothetical protein